MSTLEKPADPEPVVEAGDEKEAIEGVQSVNLTITLGSGASLNFACSLEESFADLKMSLLECEEMCYVTCYDFFIGGELLNEFIQIGSHPAIVDGGTLELRPRSYNKKSVACHVGRILNLQEPIDFDCVLPSLISELNELEASVRPKSQQGQQKLDQPQSGGKMTANKRKKAKKKRKRAAAAADNSNRSKSAASAIADAFSVEACLDTDLRRLYPQLEQIEKNFEVPLLISASKWGEPSPAREAQGDLAYLKVKVCDGSSYQITACTGGFFVNKSTKEVFNPNAASKIFHELPRLIASVNPTAEKSFETLVENRFAHGALGPFLFDPVDNRHNKLSWLTPFTPQRQRGQPGGFVRVGEELAYTPSGMVSTMRPPIDTGRDWNAEVQAIRDMEQQTMMDVVIRDRALFLLHNEFIEAVTQAAIKIVNKDVQPANPTDDPAMHLFVINNIFYTFANGDKYEDEDGELVGDKDDPFAYKISNNDILGTSIYNHTNVKGLHTVLTTLVTYKGVRVFAQAILPGILQAGPAPVVYGSLDFGKTLHWSEEMHDLMCQAAEHLSLAVHDYEAADGTKKPLAASVTAKGIRGNDGRLYIMDIDCPSVPDADWSKRWAIHRPELLRRYSDTIRRNYELQAARVAQHNSQIDKDAEEKEKQASSEQASTQTSEEEASGLQQKKEEESNPTPDQSADAETKSDIEATEKKEGKEEDKPREKAELPPFVAPKFSPNLNAVKTHGSIVAEEEEITNLKRLYENLQTFLKRVAVPTAAEDLIASEVPVDCEKLQFCMQARGVNMRYLGEMEKVMPKKLEYHHQLLLREMIVRSAKHLYNTLICNVPAELHATATAHFLSCLVNGLGSLMFATLKKASPVSDLSSLDVVKLKQSVVHRQLLEMVVVNFKATLDSFEPLYKSGELHRMAVMRAFCLKTGIRLRPRNYNLARPFTANDIAGIAPIVKVSVSANTTALSLMDAGDMFMVKGSLGDAYEAYSEALSFCHHTTGSFHYVPAMCFLKLADVMFRAGDINQAIQNAQYAIIILERVRGPDRHEVAVAYITLATYLENAGQYLRALSMLKRALYLFLLMGGDQHIGIGSLHLRIGSLLRVLDSYDGVLGHLQCALKQFEAVFGANHPKTGEVCHMMAEAHSYLRDNKTALDFEKRNYDIIVRAFGETHDKAEQSGIWMKQFTLKAVQEAKDARESTSNRLASGAGLPAPDGGETPLFSRPIDDILKYVNSGEKQKQTRRARHPFPSGRRVPKPSAFQTQP